MSKRARWKSLVALAAVLTAGVVASCLLISKIHERKEFVGKVEDGYRCRFTFSPTWQQYVEYGWEHVSPPRPDYVDDAHFKPLPPSPVRQWMSAHLFHQPAWPPDAHTFGISSCRREDFPCRIRLVGGHPEPIWVGNEQGLTQRHLIIDGCPATLIQRPLVVSGTPCQWTLMLVYKPNNAFLYAVGGLTRITNDNWFHEEMEKIVSSFHVERVAAGAISKR
jgi:hypothetical protein